MATPWDTRSTTETGRVANLNLRSWLPTVASYSPFWADRFRAAGIEAVNVTSPADLARLPAVREAEIAYVGGTGGPGLLLRPSEDQVKARASAPVLTNVARAIRRSGVDGKRRVLLEEYKPIHLHRAGRDGVLTIANTRTDLDRLHRTGARAAAVLGLTEDDYLVSAVPTEPTLGFWGLYHLALGASVLAVHPRGPGEVAEVIVDSFGLVPVTAVAVPVDEAVGLAATLIEAGVDLSRVRTLVVAGPPPAAEVRQRINEAWRAAGGAADLVVRAVWAPSAARALWAECRPGAGAGLHTYPDLELLEVLDPSSGRVATRDGDLTYTSMGWHGTALVRYQTGEYVGGLATGPCPDCGRTVPRIVGEVFEGAWEPAIDTGDGDHRADLRGVPVALGAVAGVEAWRVEVQLATARRKHDRVVVEVAPPPADPAALEAQLEASVGVPVTVVAAGAAAEVVAHAEKAGSTFADLR